MKVLLATAGVESWHREMLARVEDLAQNDRIGVHSLVGDPTAADLILFVDPHQHPMDWRDRTVRRHPLVRRFPDKSFVYDERDQPRDTLPGVYVGMPRASFDVRRHRSFAYPYLLNDVREVALHDPDLLFSFQGRRVGSVRPAVFALTHPRSVIEDTSDFDFFDASAPNLDEGRRRYRDIVGRSKFVLCPRGAGTSSVRIFEALACGRVPVILSDDWVAPHGVDWPSCSLWIQESDVGYLPSLLESAEAAWPEMSATARRTYRDWFSEDVWFHRLVDHCADLQGHGSLGPSNPWLEGATWRAGARQLRYSLRRRQRRMR